MEEQVKPAADAISRRSFLGKGLAVGAGTLGAGLLTQGLALAQSNAALNKGDVAILRFLATAEILETDHLIPASVPTNEYISYGWCPITGKATPRGSGFCFCSLRGEMKAFFVLYYDLIL